MTATNCSLTSVVLASGNAGKLREFDALLSPLGISLIAQGSLNIPDVPEPHPTFIENALAKARHASLLSGLPALAAPAGFTSAGLPVGLQIIGPVQNDMSVLQLGHAYDLASGYSKIRSTLLALRPWRCNFPT